MLNTNQCNRAHRSSGGYMKPPWRTVLFGDDSGRFSREQLGRAVRTVMERRERDRPGRPMMVRETRQGRETQLAPPYVPPAEPVPYHPRGRGGGRRRKAPPAEA